MSSRNIIMSFMQSPRTVFTKQSLMMASGVFDMRALANSIYYYRKRGLILSPRSGIYVKPGYDERELACALVSPAYISLQYVLAKSGVSFQYSEKLTCISAVSREFQIDGKTYLYRRINPELWASQKGIIQGSGYCIATPERALLDTMYLYPDIEYFDNTGGLDIPFLIELSKEYGNKSLERKIERIYG